MMMILLLMRIDFKVVYYTLNIRTHCKLKFLIVYFTLQLEPFRRSPLIQSHTALYFCKVNSIQEACVKFFVVHISKFQILQNTWKNERKNIRVLVFSLLSINLAFWYTLFCFFMLCARFQISICEPQSIWRKLLVCTELILDKQIRK